MNILPTLLDAAIRWAQAGAHSDLFSLGLPVTQASLLSSIPWVF